MLRFNHCLQLKRNKHPSLDNEKQGNQLQIKLICCTRQWKNRLNRQIVEPFLWKTSPIFDDDFFFCRMILFGTKAHIEMIEERLEKSFFARNFWQSIQCPKCFDEIIFQFIYLYLYRSKLKIVENEFRLNMSIKHRIKITINIEEQKDCTRF